MYFKLDIGLLTGMSTSGNWHCTTQARQVNEPPNKTRTASQIVDLFTKTGTVDISYYIQSNKCIRGLACHIRLQHVIVDLCSKI